MRYQGKISSWKDDQGFGFITPNGGGPQIFVHIKSLARQARRPSVNDLVTYELTTNGKGQRRAENVAFVRSRAESASAQGTGFASLLVAAVFLLFVAAAAMAGKLPVAVPGFYLVASMVSFVAYALDKSAARNNRHRTPERTLHLLSLAGGWPGALLAQRALRHKTRKQSFQITFWFTVGLNCAGFAWLLSSAGSATLRVISGLA